MASKTLRITGDKELIRILNRIKRESPKALGAALYQEGQEIISDSKDNYVPVDTAALKTSGHAELPEIKGNGVTVTIGYGGAASKYAVIVHENLTARHPVGQAKYLEEPLNNAANGMAERLSAKAAAHLKRYGK